MQSIPQVEREALTFVLRATDRQVGVFEVDESHYRVSKMDSERVQISAILV